MTVNPVTWLNWELMGNPLNWVVIVAIIFAWLFTLSLIFGPEEQ